ncbi:MAG TPA: DNA gyrase subunit A, partial [Bacteroidales bacterium]|nr:DNA gyrase subunit A [Bacteroidales bacterium]
MQFIKAPDFPTGGVIYGYDGVKEAYETGRGKIIIRGEAKIESDDNGREMIVVTSVPYQVNKSEMIKKTTELVNDKRIEGITEIRDESDRSGIRIVYELRKDVITNVVLNKLYQLTPLQSSFNINNIALVKGRPVTLNLKDLIVHFVDHRHNVIIRRTQFELDEAEKKAHILEGLLVAIDHLDEVIQLIRTSKTPDEAKTGLMSGFSLSEIQAKAILDMRLQRLTGLEREKIRQDYDELIKQIGYLKGILADVNLRMSLIKEELKELKEKYGDEPKSQIIYNASDFRIEDTIADESVVITISHMGYIKRTPLTEYRKQNRGGKGMKGSDVRDEDFLEHLFVASNHNYLLFFTEKGKCFWLRVFEIPEGTKTSKGRAIQNLISIESDDKVRAFINVKDLKDEAYTDSNFIILATQRGTIKKTSLKAYSRPRLSGINAITIHEGDQLLEAKLTQGTDEVVLALKSGRAIRFNEKTVRPMGRNAAGVRGIRLANAGDEVIGMVCIPQNKQCEILVVSENGYGKRSPIDDYRVTNRGGKGVKTINITEKTGSLIAIKDVTDSDDLMIINKSGIIIRMGVAELRVMGRATQGVRLIKINEGDGIAAVAKVEVEEETGGDGNGPTEEEPREEGAEEAPETDDAVTDPEN